MENILYLTVGISAGLTAGGNTYVNEELSGRSYQVERVDQGTLFPGSGYTKNADGFSLIGTGNVFQPGEKFVLSNISISSQPTTEGTPRYTNGFDLTPILQQLRKRLGWRPGTMPGLPALDADNLQSISGRYFNSFHSLVTINNIRENVENKDISDGQFNTYLKDLQDDAIMRSLNEVFRETELLEQKLMYTRFATMDQPVNNSGEFVGYLINVANDHGISTQINMATLYFDQDVDFNLYLFMDGNKAPLLTIPVSCTAFEHTEIDFDSLVLNYRTGRKYYFGYFQSELGTARAIREQVDVWATTLCFEAFTFTAPATDGNTDFNHNYRQYGSLPQGINLEISSFRDHTQRILRKANLFDEVVGLQVAAMVIEEIVNTTRTNKDQRQTGEAANKIYTDLNQARATDTFPMMPGLKSRIAAEFKRLRDTFFPPQEAISVSMEGDSLGIESSWFKQNWRQITNPPIQKI